jgi:hypothetical protein
MKSIQIILLFTVFCVSNYAVSQTWLPVGIAGPTYRVTALGVYDSTLIAGGFFTNMDTTRDALIWNGLSWTSANRINTNNIYCLKSYNSEIYSSGHFYAYDDPGNMAVISKFNGAVWDSVGSGIGHSVYNITAYVLALEEYNSELYAAGLFSYVSGSTIRNIARWNGSSWSDVGNAFTGGGVVCSTMTVYNGELYLGGDFTTIGGVTAKNIAKWNGSNWSAVGTGVGMNNSVNSMEVFNGDLYVGGQFTTVDGIPVNKIAKWDGVNWTAVSSGMDDAIRSLEVHNGSLYAGGDFIVAGGNTANHVAKWDGVSWSAVGTGMNDNVYALCDYNGVLYAGGLFTVASGSVANYIAQLSPSSGIIELNNSDINIYPNPSNGQFSISVNMTNNLTYNIYNSHGEIIETKIISDSNSVVDISEFPNGVYFIVLQSNDRIYTRKLVLE